ncbi:MAG: CPBP family intramembrane metalloprotease [Gemmatimonadota bacterium]|nr:CPBP family intramembrane metalloprotease [Gemmatimonadota bacterium]
MNAVSILFSTGRRLRAPWRILLFVVISAATLLLAALLEGGIDELVAARGYTPLVSEWGVPLGFLSSTAVMLRWVDNESWTYVGLDRSAAAAPKLISGSAMGLAPIAIPSVVLLLAGQLDAVPSEAGSWWAAAAISFANLFPAALWEELLLRGYVFAVLREAIGSRWTLISTSIVFGLLHVQNPGSDAQSILIVMFAGFFLGAVFLATGSLWAATMAHFAWNWFMAAGLHSPVSGLRVATPDYRVVDSGPDWLTGGSWGPEGGFGAAVGMFFVLIYLHARHLRRMES